MKTNRRNFIKALGGMTILSNVPERMLGKEAATNSQSSVNNTAAVSDKELKFNANGKFKIVQFTDTHFVYRDKRSDITLERIEEVLKAEKPDLIALTGDIVTGKPAKEGWETILGVISKFNIPFAVAWGNHDAEQGQTREYLLNLLQNYPQNLTITEPGISGVSNYILPVKSASGKTSRLLYFIDSHDYSKIEGVGGYDYIKNDQIDWYRKMSKQFTKSNGGTPIPSLAFFHIALPEYKTAASTEGAALYGVRLENVCSPEMNSGLFTAMKEMGDIEGTFVGHDHDNDYAVMWHGILLAYGRFTGSKTTYTNIPNGARVIELTDGKKGFRTWIRLKGGVIENDVIFPDSFDKD